MFFRPQPNKALKKIFFDILSPTIFSFINYGRSDLIFQITVIDNVDLICIVELYVVEYIVEKLLMLDFTKTYNTFSIIDFKK